jgi:hypothetical protein
MTPSPAAKQPKREYIVTGEMISELKDIIYQKDARGFIKWEDAVYARKYTPAPIEEFTQEQARRDFVLLRELRSQVSRLQEEKAEAARPHPPAPEPTPDNAFEVETCTLGVYLSQFPLPSETHTKICLMVNELVIEAKAEAVRAATLATTQEDADILNYWGYFAGAAILRDEKKRKVTLDILRQSTTAQEERE